MRRMMLGVVGLGMLMFCGNQTAEAHGYGHYGHYGHHANYGGGWGGGYGGYVNRGYAGYGVGYGGGYGGGYGCGGGGYGAAYAPGYYGYGYPQPGLGIAGRNFSLWFQQ